MTADGRHLGRRVFLLRVDKGYSQRRLGDLAGLTSFYISQVESGYNGNPSAAKLYRLAKALEVRMETLMGVEEL